MDEVVIDLREQADVELEAVDVGVADDTISFTIEGMIRGIEDSVLEELEGKSLTPTEIHLAEATD